MLRAAFFDFDGTLIKDKSLISFLEFQKINSTFNTEKILIMLNQLYAGLYRKQSREELNRLYYSVLKGVSTEKIESDANRWFESLDLASLINYPLIERANELAQLGYKIIIVSGSFFPLINQIKDFLAVDDIICSEPEKINGFYTGELTGKPCIGINKKRSVIRYSLEKNIDLENSFAFGDDETDKYMLEIVGNGVMVT